MKLTDMGIKRAKPKEKSYTLADGNGLSWLVETNISKGGRYRYPKYSYLMYVSEYIGILRINVNFYV